MSQNSSSGDHFDIDQTDLFDKLDVAFTVILIVAGVLTFPPACFVYFRILTLNAFKGQYLMKLFVLNGISNMLIYLVNLIAVQFSNWPFANHFYTDLKDSYMSVVLRYLQDFSICLMWQTTFFISLNRLLSLTFEFLLNKYAFRYFLIASISSFSLSILVCSPLFFSRHTYYKFPLPDGGFGYIPYIPPAFRWTSTPASVFQLSLAAATLLVNGVICYLVMQMRKEYSAKMRSRPEQGLLLSSFISVMMHVTNDLLLLSTKYFNMITLAYFITLTIAVATTLPFWTMMVFAHSMRRAVLSGTGFEGGSRATVRVRSATTRNTVSAAF